MKTKDKEEKIKKKKATNKNFYFTPETQQAIINYNLANTKEEKNDLYCNYIQPVFSELIDKIVFTYKFNHLTNIDSLKEDCFIYLISILSKFNPDKGSTAFSYFTVITKNWFSYKAKIQNKRKLEETDLDEVYNQENLEKIVVYNDTDEQSEKKLFYHNLMMVLDSWEDETEKDTNAYIVIQAIKQLFQNIDDVEIFNKKAIYIYMREMTGLKTSEIFQVLKKIRDKYFQFKKKWDSNQLNEIIR